MIIAKVRVLLSALQIYYFVGIFLTITISCKETHNFEGKKLFRINLPGGLNSCDPAFANNQSAIWVVQQLFNGLVELDSNLRVIPSLAKRWSISEDGRSYEFTLRKNVTYHKHSLFGKDSTRELTAHDFVYSFTRICDPKTASPGQWIFNDKLLGVKEFQAKQTARIAGLLAINDTTLRLTLTKPFPPFLTLLTMPYAYAIPREIVEAYGKDFRNQPIGTGPFILKRWQERKLLVLHKNPNYYEAGLPYLDAITARFINNKLSAFNAFITNELDYLESPDNAVKDDMFERDGGLREKYVGRFQCLTSPQLTVEYLGLLTNDASHPLHDKRVRLALNHAIDKAKYARYFLATSAEPANAGLLPSGLPGYNPAALTPLAYDLERAKRLIAEAGYPNGEGFPPLTLHSNPSYQTLAEFVQNELDKIGVKVTIEMSEGASLREKIASGKIHFWRASWIADYPDGENFLALFASANTPPNGPNYTRYTNPQYDSLFAHALTQADDSARFALYNRMENLLLQDSPAIFLYYYKTIRLAQNGFHNLPNSPNILQLPLKYVK